MILAIDPGHVDSAWVLYGNGSPREWGKWRNEDVLDRIRLASDAEELVIEKIAGYGMAVGAEVFDTCVWVGRFMQCWLEVWGGPEPTLITRKVIKLHLCGNTAAKDPNVRQAIIDQFGPGRARAIGRKAAPGPLYGVAGDVWSAIAVAITHEDQSRNLPKTVPNHSGQLHG